MLNFINWKLVDEYEKKKVFCIFLVTMILFVTGCNDTPKIKSGKYVFQYEDGSEAVIEIAKDYIILSNMDFSIPHEQTGSAKAFMDKSEKVSEGIEISDEEYEELVNKYMDAITIEDFKNEFQDRKCSYETEYHEEEQTIDIYLTSEIGDFMVIGIHYDLKGETLDYYDSIFVKN